MDHVLLFSQRRANQKILGPHSHLTEKLVESLLESHYRVTLLTNEVSRTDQDPQTHDYFDHLQQEFRKFQLLTPIKKWGFLESLRSLPFVMAQGAHIMHLVFTPPWDQRFLFSANLMASALKAAQKRLWVTSLTELNTDHPLPPLMRTIVAQSDVIFVANEFQRHWLSAMPESPSHQSVQTFPFLPPSKEGVAEKHWLTKEFRSLILVPGEISEYRSYQQVAEVWAPILKQYPHLGLALLTKRHKGTPKERRQFWRTFSNFSCERQVAFTGELSEAQSLNLMRQSSAIYCAGLNTFSSRLTHLQHLSMSEQIPLILNTQQAQMNSFSWKHQTNCWIKTANNLGELFSNSSQLDQIRTGLQKETQKVLKDHAGNFLSRIYSEAFAYL